MLATRHYHDSDMLDTDMRDLEKELGHTLASHYDGKGEPMDGLFTLTRQMDIDDDDQFDVDLVILDFLVYKALDSVFKWRCTSNPFESELPRALVTMTVGE